MDLNLLKKIAKDHDVAEFHGLAGYLYARGIMVTPEYRAQYTQQFSLNEPLLQTMREIDARLARSKLRPVLLGGAALLETAYKNLGERSLSNIDILISENQRNRFRGILRSLGFQEAEPTDEFTVLFSRGNVAVKIHAGKVFADERRGAAWRSVDSPRWQAFRTLAPADQIVQILGQWGTPGEQRLYRLVDVIEYWKTQPELSVEDVLRRAEEKKRLRAVRSGFQAIKRARGPDFLRNNYVLRPYRQMMYARWLKHLLAHRTIG